MDPSACPRRPGRRDSQDSGDPSDGSLTEAQVDEAAVVLHLHQPLTLATAGAGPPACWASQNLLGQSYLSEISLFSLRFLPEFLRLQRCPGACYQDVWTTLSYPRQLDRVSPPPPRGSILRPGPLRAGEPFVAPSLKYRPNGISRGRGRLYPCTSRV